MLGMISAVIGVLVLFATQRAFPELNERFKSFHPLGIFCWQVPLPYQRLTASSFMLNLGSNTMSAPSRGKKKWYQIQDTTPICLGV